MSNARIARPGFVLLAGLGHLGREGRVRIRAQRGDDRIRRQLPRALVDVVPVLAIQWHSDQDAHPWLQERAVSCSFQGSDVVRVAARRHCHQRYEESRGLGGHVRVRVSGVSRGGARAGPARRWLVAPLAPQDSTRGRTGVVRASALARTLASRVCGLLGAECAVAGRLPPPGIGTGPGPRHAVWRAARDRDHACTAPRSRDGGA